MFPKTGVFPKTKGGFSNVTKPKWALKLKIRRDFSKSKVKKKQRTKMRDDCLFVCSKGELSEALVWAVNDGESGGK